VVFVQKFGHWLKSFNILLLLESSIGIFSNGIDLINRGLQFA